MYVRATQRFDTEVRRSQKKDGILHEDECSVLLNTHFFDGSVGSAYLSSGAAARPTRMIEQWVDVLGRMPF